MQNERNSLGKPQLFVQLTFGVSWSDRHIPRTHTLSYTSKHLKNARNSGHFPRQEPCHQHRRQDSVQRQHQHRGERHHHHRDNERPRGRATNSRPRHPGTLSPPRESRSDSRRTDNERGSSAPPAVHDGPWSDEEGGPSATLFPRPARTNRNPPHVWKDLPTNPARFRLGEDGLPWSASVWPFDPDSNEDEPPFANLPTTLPLSPPSERRHGEDPQRVKELESLSTAMVTVDNGFENQWWNQGERESIALFPSGSADAEEYARPMSMADAVLLSAAEPPSGVDTYSPNIDSLRDLVSPLSDISPTFNMSSPLQRSNSTRSDELWMGRGDELMDSRPTRSITTTS
ncbi:hypothetical protein E0Z10_g2547 [Xylaria hypoxylon]|uniref:Uncharacterized protein n=1 Tax=Xylaria hypoxylon TaxID=37992 RepID=A0A4Z0YQT1_9PEZI|nr:hypothetical protein E0Z10_g2547 [Xylaria hypoxylon]